jgi:phthiodiolone/phenolphthiodiolone dimycocerosates ketoreductase
MSITPAAVLGVTGWNRDDVDGPLDSLIVKMTALGVPAQAWARLGVEHLRGADFAGVQDLIPQAMDTQMVFVTHGKSSCCT